MKVQYTKKKSKPLVTVVRAAPSSAVDLVSRKDGVVTVRRSFFFTHGYTAEQFAAGVVSILKAEGIQAELIDHGQQYVAFNGEHTVAEGSHWWVRLEIAE